MIVHLLAYRTSLLKIVPRPNKGISTNPDRVSELVMVARQGVNERLMRARLAPRRRFERAGGGRERRAGTEEFVGALKSNTQFEQ